MLEVTKLKVGPATFTTLVNPIELDGPFQKWALAIWNHPTESWSFKLMYESLVEALDSNRKLKVIPRSHAAWLEIFTKNNVVLITGVYKRLAESEAQVASLQESKADLERRLAESEAQVASLLQSRSWRITAPIRAVSELARKAKLNIITFIKKRILSAIHFGIRVVERQTWLKKWIARALMHFPSLNARLRHIISHSRVHVPEAESGTSFIAPDLELLAVNTTDIALPKRKGERYLYVYADHTVSYESNTGVQRVARTLSRGLLEAGEQVRFVKWDAQSQQCILINLQERQALSKWNGPSISPQEAAIYSSPEKDKVAIEPVPQGENHWLIVPEVPYINNHKRPVTLELIMWAKRSHFKTGFVFYDAAPLLREELEDVAEIHAQYMQHLLLADAVWPVSDWSKADLISYWIKNQLADKNTMPEVVTQTLPIEIGVPRADSACPSDTRILSVGSITPHRNQATLLEAFLNYCRKNPKTPWRLTLIGHISPLLAKQISKACKSGYVDYCSHISDSELSDLYSRCGFTVFPSVQEGFGLPILESLWAGKPCICANFGSMDEVARGGGCLTVDTKDVALLEEAIVTLINDDGLRHHLSNEAIKRSIKSPMEYAVGISSYIDEKGLPISELGTIYYWIDSTILFYGNTGIQRVSRQLARAWTEIGVKLIAVKWGGEDQPMIPASDEDLAIFSEWNGPRVNSYAEWVDPGDCKNGWFFMPEIPSNRSAHERQKLMQTVRSNSLKTAVVFHDAIPLKMNKIYPADYSNVHKQYMIELFEYDLIFPISRFTSSDIEWFLSSVISRPHGLTNKIKANPLAEEFAESDRVKKKKEKNSNDVNILCVGVVEPRKNHEKFLQAFITAAGQLSEQGLSLNLNIIGGSISLEPDLVLRVRAIVSSYDNINWEENTDDTRLQELYEECDFTIYPSIEEGFGMPIVESLWFGKPCIAANFGAMKEVGNGGGVLAVDTTNVDAMAESIALLARDKELLDQLTTECFSRKFKSWQDYAAEISLRMQEIQPKALPQFQALKPGDLTSRSNAMNVLKRPILSVCISTYNRAEWLASSLRNWTAQHPTPHQDVELFICDNASSDHTSEIVQPYLDRSDFVYHKNTVNVGMLGNLRETAHLAQGNYIWIIGDDDLLLPGAIDRVLNVINNNQDIALVYLNYAYTREDDARNIKDMEKFFKEATPIAPAEEDRIGPIRDICARNENFFTAIYTLVFRRDHALLAYSQDTSGRPFSSMLTCIPTTHYVLNHMMDESGVWVGEPQLVVNMNVSWMKYASLWILERIPEVYEVAEQKGVSSTEMDRWWLHTLPGAVHFFEEIYTHDPLDNAKFFSPEIFVRRFKHLPEFAHFEARLKTVYQLAHDKGHPAARLPVHHVFI